ncbi:hypothetical protein DSCW_16430 [Desulfosarcina widdelii]|uniref:Cyclophilin-like domain-containing protein n=1 Tax=Desulfosarcina widdelii TaxID=947919 RepID=A0A5K7YXY8_9BACT|nr:cyclophilin-like fold protein [Desulfosarcina widdelii]BBO74226.1 hypothetical protein DSCW_16430 [Desulfosarcina widdelii]
MKSLLSFSAVMLMLLSFAGCSTVHASNAGSKTSNENGTKITLTIGNTVIPAILHNTAPARDLAAMLPVTVSLNRGPVDYCGGFAPMHYEKKDVQAGYRSGDLAYWIPGRDFVIFTETKEASSGNPDLVILGQISTDIQAVRDLGSTIKVTIDLDR